MLKKMKQNKKGFTLAELLIVVAIIAVLVAISVPIFTSQLEKSREAVDAANLRSAYAEVMADALTGKTDTTKTVAAKQTVAGWGTTFDFPSDFTVAATTASSGQSWTVKVTVTDGAVTGATATIG